MAHGVHLTDLELMLLKERGTSISHCPTSNTLLKSGLCDVRKIQYHEINVGLGTGELVMDSLHCLHYFIFLDVSGGTSPSIIEAMRSAIATSIHISMGKDNYSPLTYEDVFYLATLGGANGNYS